MIREYFEIFFNLYPVELIIGGFEAVCTLVDFLIIGSFVIALIKKENYTGKIFIFPKLRILYWVVTVLNFAFGKLDTDLYILTVGTVLYLIFGEIELRKRLANPE